MATRKAPAKKAASVRARFGRRIKALRNREGWSLFTLSVYSGVSKSFVFDLEKGLREPCLEVQETLAKTFGLTISQLMRGV